jgi:hypothetical protein
MIMRECVEPCPDQRLVYPVYAVSLKDIEGLSTVVVAG